MLDEKCEPVTAASVVLSSARVEAEAKRRRDSLSAGDRQRAATMAERVRGPAPAYMSEVGAGGELIPASVLCENSRALEFFDTVERPDYVAVDASRDRLELANEAGALESGLDLADSIGAKNSAEKMLAHQMAAVHRSAMKMMGLVNYRVERMDGMLLRQGVSMDDLQRLNMETCRMAGAVTRMMGSYQQGLLTLHRLRTGGTQHVVVERLQQVNVNEGGQALVAGEMKSKGGGRRKRGGGKSKNER